MITIISAFARPALGFFAGPGWVSARAPVKDPAIPPNDPAICFFRTRFSTPLAALRFERSNIHVFLHSEPEERKNSRRSEKRSAEYHRESLLLVEALRVAHLVVLGELERDVELDFKQLVLGCIGADLCK